MLIIGKFGFNFFWYFGVKRIGWCEKGYLGIKKDIS